MNDLSIFTKLFEGHDIRFAEEDGKRYIIMIDVYRAMGNNYPRQNWHSWKKHHPEIDQYICVATIATQGQSRSCDGLSLRGFIKFMRGVVGAFEDKFQDWAEDVLEQQITERIQSNQAAITPEQLIAIGQQMIVLRDQNTQLEGEVQAAQPAIDYHKDALACENSISIKAVSVIIGGTCGRDILFAFLRDMKILYREDGINFFYAKYNSWFDVAEKHYGDRGKYKYPKIMVNPKGVEKIMKLWRDYHQEALELWEGE